MRRWLLLVLGGLAVLTLLAAGWFGLSAWWAYLHLSAAQAQIESAQSAVAARDIPAAQKAISEATQSAHDAHSQVNNPVWWLAGLIPKLGDTPRAVRGVTNAVDEALTAVEPVARVMGGLEPNALIQAGGQLNLGVVKTAVPLLAAAATGLQQASATLAATPQAADGAMVMGQVAQAQEELAEQLAKVQAPLAALTSVADLAVPLLGDQTPKRYFFAILNPNESRPGGGFLGTWAVVRAEKGKLTVAEVGSNTGLPDFEELPIDLGAEYENRYGSDPALNTNSSLSPHFPNAGKLWLEYYRAKTRQHLDGVVAADVVALGDLLTASGRTVTMKDGTTLNGAQLTDFALRGVYERYPESWQAAERKQYQEEVAKAALDEITAASNPEAMVRALAAAASQRRLMVYVTDPAAEGKLLEYPIGGSLAVEPGPNVMFSTIQDGASKLDTWLAEDVTYEVGRCPDESGQVRSQLTVGLENTVPEGQDLPNYITAKRVGPDGPINLVSAQVHLPVGAQITDVTVDGLPTSYVPFTEQGRPSLYVKLELQPRVPAEVQVFFTEPKSEQAGNLTVQPLALPAVTKVVDVPCAGTGG